jgi:hypothetical protein
MHIVLFINVRGDPDAHIIEGGLYVKKESWFEFCHYFHNGNVCIKRV